MSKVPAATVLILLIWINAASQTNAKQTRARKAEERVAQLERDWSAAFLRHDIATIDRILADDYVGTDGRGIVTNKAQELEEARPRQARRPFTTFCHPGRNSHRLEGPNIRRGGHSQRARHREDQDESRGSRDSVPPHHGLGES